MDILLRTEKVKPSELLKTIIASANKGDLSIMDQPLIGIDPGQTSGVAKWNPVTQVITLEQWDTNIIGPSYTYLLGELLLYSFSHIRYEDYRVYSDKADTHINNNLHTAQWIGGIQVAAHVTGIPITCKMAQAAKVFWTDEKLAMINAYARGVRHARDAMRHLLLLMTFK